MRNWRRELDGQANVDIGRVVGDANIAGKSRQCSAVDRGREVDDLKRSIVLWKRRVHERRLDERNGFLIQGRQDEGRWERALVIDRRKRRAFEAVDVRGKTEVVVWCRRDQRQVCVVHAQRRRYSRERRSDVIDRRWRRRRNWRKPVGHKGWLKRLRQRLGCQRDSVNGGKREWRADIGDGRASRHNWGSWDNRSSWNNRGSWDNWDRRDGRQVLRERRRAEGRDGSKRRLKGRQDALWRRKA